MLLHNFKSIYSLSGSSFGHPPTFPLFRTVTKKATKRKRKIELLKERPQLPSKPRDANEKWFDAEKVSAAIPATKLPAGLYLTATPIGNLADLSARALHVLKSADGVCCEDTRVTQKLLARYDIHNKLYAYHEHSSVGKASSLLDLVQQGQSIALVSDAGVPTISDPGQDIVSQACSLSLPVVTIPGPSAVVSALSISGFSGTKFVFDGFLPRVRTDRVKQLKILKGMSSTHTIVFFESKHRIMDSLADCIAVWGELHCCVVVRELTKVHEEVIRGTLKQVSAKVSSRTLGEFTVLLAAGTHSNAE